MPINAKQCQSMSINRSDKCHNTLKQCQPMSNNVPNNAKQHPMPHYVKQCFALHYSELLVLEE
eukprot:280857-Pyramimonas_sp.AAC.1